MKLRRKRRGPISVPTASMGDIAFLLIIFFMVCSNFAKESGIRFKPPSVVDLAPVRESGLSVVVDQDGAIFLNGRPVESAATLGSQIEGLLQGKTDPLARNVIFKCDLGVAKRLFEPVLDAIVRAGGTVVAIGEKRAKEQT